jgi:hypothetical protein
MAPGRKLSNIDERNDSMDEPAHGSEICNHAENPVISGIHRIHLCKFNVWEVKNRLDQIEGYVNIFFM